MNQITYMQTAKLFAEQAHCIRTKVGTALVDRTTGRLLATGYNGTIRNFPNCNELFKIDSQGNGWISSSLPQDIMPKEFHYYEIKEFDHTWYRITNLSEKEKDSPMENEEFKWFRELHHSFSFRYEIHSEVNAIMSLCKAGNTVPFNNIDLYVTTLPCDQCLKTIACAGIKHVYYDKEYDRQNTQELIARAKTLGVKIKHLPLSSPQ